MSTPDESPPDDPEIRRRRRREQEQAPLDEAGEGESEGFELAEADLIEHASHGDQHTTIPIGRDSWDEAEEDVSAGEYGGADGERPEDLGSK